MEKAYAASTAGGTRPLAPSRPGSARGRWSARFDFNTPAAVVADQLRCGFGAVTVTTGCTGGLDAIGAAMAAVRRGELDVAVAGAAEAPITPLVVAAFARIGATSRRNEDPPRASRPFDAGRDGFVLGEGAGMVVIETAAHALARGARIHGTLAGYASVNSCFHMTDIPVDGRPIARSARLALRDAQGAAEEVDAINAHGSSTPQNDVAEAAAYRQLFGPRGAEIPVTSLKSQIGHPLAASNSIEVVAALLSLRHGLIPPTINLARKDARCPLDVVTGEPRRVRVRCMLKTSSGFAGIHSSLVLRRHDEVAHA
jgi:3-oxoacyl-(acyl-carrier-protein) synthase